MINLKRIEDITIDDIRSHRWCYYQNDEKGYDAFEYVISDSHPDFSDDVIELEFAEFKFLNGKVAYGLYDGPASFNIVTPNEWYSFWYGAAEPEKTDIERMSNFLKTNDYQLPVEASAKWSRTAKKYNGIQYINNDGETIEISI